MIFALVFLTFAVSIGVSACLRTTETQAPGPQDALALSASRVFAHDGGENQGRPAPHAMTGMDARPEIIVISFAHSATESCLRRGGLAPHVQPLESWITDLRRGQAGRGLADLLARELGGDGHLNRCQQAPGV